MIGQIELTVAEQELVSKIVFDHAKYVELERAAVLQHGEQAATLMRSLLVRKTIPENRLRYFEDAGYNVSNPKASKADLFLRKVSTREKMYRDGNFVKYLRYFIFGANLPKPMQVAFHVCSQDDEDNLVKLARAQARSVTSIKPHERPEAFYQLALDCDCEQWNARSIRDAVMAIK